jgi:2-dehydro-3-deoxyglucarate aldolase/4-hydroxy-2-oxoheptanedioate aldolase
VTSLRARVLAKKPLLGVFLSEPSATMAEVLAQVGFDFLVLDTEHGTWDAPGVAAVIRAADAAAIPAIVRVPSCHAQAETGRALDAGAAGTLFPRADGAAAVRAALESAKYAPVGRRGLAGVRANRYAGVPLDHWVLEANENTAVIVQIETAGGLNAADDIASEKWVDVLFVGPNDLSQALGVPGHYDDPRYVAGVERVAQVAAEHGRAAGIMLRSPDQIPDLRKLGYSVFTTSDRTLLAQSAKAWRGALPR